jgi:hypothetical protein
LVDYAVDFHAGGSRFNAPQIRPAPNNPELITLANNAPFTLFSKNVAEFRNASHKLNVKNVTFEGGKSLDIKSVTDAGTRRKRLLSHLDMLDLRNNMSNPINNNLY